MLIQRNRNSYGGKASGGRKPSNFGWKNRQPSSKSNINPSRSGSNFRSRPNTRFGVKSGRRRFSESIDASRFVKKSFNQEALVEQRAVNSFADFSLCPALQNNLKNRGYITPTQIQDQALNHVISGRDLIGLASTGTGKTAVFLLPLMNKVFLDRSQKTLVIAPTRELAQQIEAEFRLFSFGMQIYSTVCVGGAPIFKQIQSLKRNPHFIIGTPGRLKDLCDRKLIRLSTFKNIVIDEIDRMLDMGFIEDIKHLLSQIPEPRQSLFFSATMPPKIRDLVGLFLKDPVTVEIHSGQTAANVDQDVIRVKSAAQKFEQLEEILSQPELKKVLIFSETKRDVERLANNLSSGGFKAESIHGDKKQNQRQRALEAFKRDHVNILVATDVAARGLDIDDISHVINYTVPQTYDDYIHRIGRTGRCNKKGVALTFVG